MKVESGVLRVVVGGFYDWEEERARVRALPIGYGFEDALTNLYRILEAKQNIENEKLYYWS